MTDNSTCKWKKIDRQIRDQIVSGALKPGQKLPTYGELERQYNASRVTMQQVIPQLKRDGFIFSLPRQGMFVSERPPHLNRIAIVVPRDEHQVSFWIDFITVAEYIAKERGKELVVYRNLLINEECEKQLQDDVNEHLLSGMICLYEPVPGDYGYSFVANTSLPRVTASRMDARPSTPASFHMNSPALIHRALDYLQENGCSKIAAFHNVGKSTASNLCQQEIARRGFYSPDFWQFRIMLEDLPLAEKITYLLLSRPKADRPDGIIITDDNLSKAVVKGAASSGINLSNELHIVSHCNWGLAPRDLWPVKNIGYDLKSLATDIFNALEHYDETKQYRIGCNPVFEEELPGRDNKI